MVLPGLSLTLNQGEILALLGPSGCGKSTLLNILAGFVAPDQGYVELDGQRPKGPGPDRAVVFQDDALFPWLTALENITLGLRALGIPKVARRKAAAEMLGLVGLVGYENHLPRELSGGMRQRLALARVLALNPKVLLMDEPFAALDAITREQMQDFFLELHQALGITVLLVTHDLYEAWKLADAILVMSRNPKEPLKRFNLASSRPRDMESLEFPTLKSQIKEALQRI